jgi:hypothetical protein
VKLVHLILAHDPSGLHQLERFINRLYHDDAVFYIHVDLKTDISLFVDQFKLYSKVKFISNRVNVKWAGYSMIEAELNSFQEIVEAVPDFDYLNLLSAYSYPIKPIQEFHDFLANNLGKAFMDCLDVNTEWTEAIARVEQYHLVNFNFPGKYFLENLINKLLPKRKVPFNMIVKGRSQWFTISRKHIEYVLNELKTKKTIEKFFKLTWGPDELLFQTLLFNSPFQHDIINNNLRYIDWSEKRKNPKTFVSADFDRIMQSNQFFARKFDSNIDSNILDLIDQRILK